MFSMHSKYLDPILANSFTIDFIEIILTPKRPGLPTYKGPGSISQDDKGKLSLKLYNTLSQDMNFAGHHVVSYLTSTPGKLIQEKDYYRLEARDLFEDIWNSEIFLTSLNPGKIVSEDLQKIERVKELDSSLRRNHETVLMIIPGKFKIPFNETQNMSDGIWKRNICKINICGINLRIEEKENYTTLQASSENGQLPENFDRRLLEALSIFLGSLIFPICYEHRYMESEKAVIWSNRSDCNKGELIPVKHPFDWEVDSFRNFIECYLRTFEKANQPFFIYWHRIHASWQSGYTENMALIVCTSIEGIIKEYYRDTGYFDPKGILRQLSKRGWFEEKIVDEWGYMRNMSAHGERFFFEGTIKQKQNNFDKLHSCMHIFNVLLLRLIGFRGKYTNYSKVGWPLEDFPGENASDSGEVDGEI